MVVDSTLVHGRSSMESKYLRNLHKLMNYTLASRLANKTNHGLHIVVSNEFKVG